MDRRHSVPETGFWGTEGIFGARKPPSGVRDAFGGSPCQKQASTVRERYSVSKKASCGTRRIFRSIRCKKQAPTVRERYSVPETPSYGTE